MIWLISPDSDTRRLIRLNLSKRGFRVLEASSQDELVSSRTKPQLIILDVDPPGKLKREVAEALRRNPWAQGTPLILLLTIAPTPSQLARLQPARWVEKPLAMNVLLASVRECLA
jgi:DNA-binding response OmpR family regulator